MALWIPVFTGLPGTRGCSWVLTVYGIETWSCVRNLSSTFAAVGYLPFTVLKLGFVHFLAKCKELQLGTYRLRYWNREKTFLRKNTSSWLQSGTYRLRYSNFHRHKKHTDSGLIPGSVCFLHAEQKTGCLCMASRRRTFPEGLSSQETWKWKGCIRGYTIDIRNEVVYERRWQDVYLGCICYTASRWLMND